MFTQWNRKGNNNNCFITAKSRDSFLHHNHFIIWHEREKGNIKVTCCSLVEITKDGYSSLVLLKGFLADYNQLWGASKV